MSGCPCGMPPGGIEGWSADWHRRHRTHHLATFPDVDQGTRDNLDQFIRRAEVIERTEIHHPTPSTRTGRNPT